MSVTDKVLDALKAAIQLDGRVTAMANNVAELAREVRDIDRRLVRVETTIDLAPRAGSAGPPSLEDRRK
ncbi:MAG: hypothetical protein IT562_17045 [Alphaproteobacteria bacterium]|nr:hypothetical protein [Alphaproteobacteria bacterium]